MEKKAIVGFIVWNLLLLLIIMSIVFFVVYKDKIWAPAEENETLGETNYSGADYEVQEIPEGSNETLIGNARS